MSTYRGLGNPRQKCLPVGEQLPYCRLRATRRCDTDDLFPQTVGVFFVVGEGNDGGGCGRGLHIVEIQVKFDGRPGVEVVAAERALWTLHAG